MSDSRPGLVLSLDIGTSSIRAALYTSQGRAVPGAESARPHRVHTTADGGAEMHPEEVVQRAVRCAAEAVERAGSQARRIVGVGVCTYWHSILGVGANGRATTPIYLWSDTRSVAEVEALRQRLDAPAVYARTGCPLHTSYVGPRILWIARTQPESFRRSQRWMSIGEYLYLRLFGEAACSHSMASGTGLFDLSRLRWDPEVLAALPIEEEQLSTPVAHSRASVGLRPEFARTLPRLSEVPWFPPLGDGACSNVGSGAVSRRRVAIMVGTSGAMRVLCPSGGPTPPEGLWAYLLDQRRFLLGGALSNGGSFYTWLTRTLRVGQRGRLEETLSVMEPDAHGLTVLPFLMGERSPGWHGDARAVIAGLSAHTSPQEIIRAGLESVAYRFALNHARLRDRLDAGPDYRVIATGGALLYSPLWMQIIADVLNRPVVASREKQASGRGAALMALEALGMIRGIQSAPFAFGKVYHPDAARHARYMEALARHTALYRRLLE